MNMQFFVNFFSIEKLFIPILSSFVSGLLILIFLYKSFPQMESTTAKTMVGIIMLIVFVLVRTLQSTKK